MRERIEKIDQVEIETKVGSVLVDGVPQAGLLLGQSD